MKVDNDIDDVKATKNTRGGMLLILHILVQRLALGLQIQASSVPALCHLSFRCESSHRLPECLAGLPLTTSSYPGGALSSPRTILTLFSPMRGGLASACA